MDLRGSYIDPLRPLISTTRLYTGLRGSKEVYRGLRWAWGFSVQA